MALSAAEKKAKHNATAKRWRDAKDNPETLASAIDYLKGNQS